MDTSALPTKNNLIRINEKIKLSRQGHELLDKKKFILTNEKDKVKKQKEKLESKLKEALIGAIAKLKEASIDIGLDELIDISEEIENENSIDVKYKTIMGVEIPSVVYENNELDLKYGLFGTTVSVDECILGFSKIKDYIIELAEMENTIFRLDESIKSVQKRSNALQDIIIPEDEKLAKEISDILEERDREEFTRLKMLKNGINSFY